MRQLVELFNKWELNWQMECRGSSDKRIYASFYSLLVINAVVKKSRTGKKNKFWTINNLLQPTTGYHLYTLHSIRLHDMHTHQPISMFVYIVWLVNCKWDTDSKIKWLGYFLFIFFSVFFTTPTAVSSFTVIIVFVFDQFWDAKQQICEIRILEENNNPIICLASILFANKFQRIDKKK